MSGKLNRGSSHVVEETQTPKRGISETSQDLTPPTVNPAVEEAEDNQVGTGYKCKYSNHYEEIHWHKVKWLNAMPGGQSVGSLALYQVPWSALCYTLRENSNVRVFSVTVLTRSNHIVLQPSQRPQLCLGQASAHQ